MFIKLPPSPSYTIVETDAWIDGNIVSVVVITSTIGKVLKEKKNNKVFNIYLLLLVIGTCRLDYNDRVLTYEYTRVYIRNI